MKSGNRDIAEGKFSQVKGKAKQAAGIITDNPKREAQGKAENLLGIAQEKRGDVKKVFGH